MICYFITAFIVAKLSWYFKVDPVLDPLGKGENDKKLALLFGLFWPFSLMGVVLTIIWIYFNKIMTKIVSLLMRLL